MERSRRWLTAHRLLCIGTRTSSVVRLRILSRSTRESLLAAAAGGVPATGSPQSLARRPAAVMARPQLKSVAELEKLRQGNDFILRIAEELSRPFVERAQEAEARLAAVQREHAQLREGGGNADTAEWQARIKQLEAEVEAKGQGASGTVPLDQHERLVEELAAERNAHRSAVSAREEVEELLRSQHCCGSVSPARGQ